MAEPVGHLWMFPFSCAHLCLWCCPFFSLLVLWPRNQQDSSICSLILWFLPECGSLHSVGRPLGGAKLGHFSCERPPVLLSGLGDSWVSVRDSGSRKCSDCGENWTGFTDSRVACDVFSLPGSYISKKENSHAWSIWSRVPRIHAVLQRQDIIEAFFSSRNRCSSLLLSPVLVDP